MKVLHVKSAGFCMSVRRAMSTLLDRTRRGRKPVRTLGPLIHNPQVIEMLEGKGVRILGQGRPAPEHGTVVIRAHGVAPVEKEDLRAGGCDVVDATCPHVIRIQKLIQRHVGEGDAILIVGDRGHAEVNGLLGHARGLGHVVAEETDVDALPELERVCVVSQTTQSHERFDQILERIQRRWPGCAVHRTICNSTRRRQSETVEIARQADAMIVVGGRNSANSVRLAQLAAATGTPTLHVETAAEIDFEPLRGKKTIGLTAGASTPNWMIADVCEHLNEFFRQEWGRPRRGLYRLLQLLLDTNLYVALGAACMAYGCARMVEEAQFGPLEAYAATLCLFGMHSLNVHHERRAERYSSPLRWRFHERWGRTLVAIGVVAIGIALWLSSHLGILGFGLMFVVCCAGVLYPATIVPKSVAPYVRYRRLSDMPGSKDIFMGLAWACVLALPPLLPTAPEDPFGTWRGDLKPTLAVALVFFFVFALVFVRSVVYDLRDIQGDQMIGRETIPVVLGQSRTWLLLVGLTAALLVAMLAATYTYVLTPVGYLMIVPVLYTALYLYLFRRGAISPHGLLFETIIGGKFILVGALAGLHQWLLWFAA